MNRNAAILSLTFLGLTTIPVAAQTPAANAPSPAVRELITSDAPLIALVGVRLIDGTGSAPKEDQTIVIENGRITAVGSRASVKVPAGAHIMELRDHTVIPGIVGMHNHTFYTTASGRRTQLAFSAPRLYLASGVTTVRTTGSMAPYSEINMKRAIDTGRAPGPRMHITGPYITGPTSSYMTGVETEEAARRVVRYWVEEGVTWFKAYTTISRADLGAAIDEAHKLGAKFTGHLCSVSFREAVALKIDNLEHGLFTNSDYVEGKQPDRCPQLTQSLLALDVNGPAVQATFKDMIDHHVPMTSTLAVYELSYPGRPPVEQRMLDAMSPEVRTEYRNTRETIEKNKERSTVPQVFRKAQEYERAFVKAGGLLAAGVDPTGNGGALPGFGDQRNYELLIESGFTPAQVVQIMTLNGAKILGIDKDLGSVQVGKTADLVVISGNLAAQPARIREVQHVFKGGVAYDPAKLVASVKGTVGIQ